MAEEVDLAAYLGRVGYEGPAADASLRTLSALVQAHTRSIPFENLNPLLRQPVQLDVAALQDKLVRQQRGGYCYEHNLLFMHVLQALGFGVQGLAARVLWNAPEGAVRPRTHMLLLVQVEGQARVVDVGFGGLTLTGTLLMEPRMEQSTPHEPFRLLGQGADHLLQALTGGQWRTLYRFDLQPQLLPDYELASWYLCHHPQSHFIHNLIAARPDAGRRYALLNNQLSIHSLGGPSERRIIATAGELRQVLQHDFRLAVPQGPEVEALLQRVVSQQP
jgi:N-hydroxyarylamine O-acetyltransferase